MGRGPTIKWDSKKIAKKGLSRGSGQEVRLERYRRKKARKKVIDPVSVLMRRKKKENADAKKKKSRLSHL